MIIIRKNLDRGIAEHGWLHAKHTFSFSGYYDEKFMGFRKLRVINEDCVEPGQGFPTHGHKNMEIVTYVLSGALEHKDSLGNGSVIVPGEVQLMSAGKGIQHSEFNHSQSEQLQLLQIWIESAEKDGVPTYQQQDFKLHQDKFTLVVSPNGERNSLKIKQDVKIYRGLLNQNEKIQYKLEKERHAWIQIAKGNLKLGDSLMLMQGDAAGFTEGDMISMMTENNSCEFLLFDLN